MIIKFSGKTMGQIDEKIVLLVILGNLEAVQNGVITIDETEKFIFSPHMVRKLKNKKCNKKIIELVEKGCELEDIDSLIPEKLNQIINELKTETLKLISIYETFNRSFWLEEE